MTAKKLSQIKINRVPGLGADLACSVQVDKSWQRRARSRKDVTGLTQTKHLRLRTDFRSHCFKLKSKVRIQIFLIDQTHKTRTKKTLI